MRHAMEKLRWAFRFAQWNPDQQQWTLANQCIQTEEQDRISKFVFKKDAKSAMAGRLLMRKAIADTLSIPYAQIKLERTEKGKPFLSKSGVETGLPNFNFNVSHQGEYAVLAAETLLDVGVDIMQVEVPNRPGGVRQFFDTMSRQFTYFEWKTIKGTIDEQEQVSRFYRFWCLKESYVKALGVGIGFDLQRISFQTPTLHLEKDVVTTDTRVFIDDEKQDNWKFEETKLDGNHLAAVALKTMGSGTDDALNADIVLTETHKPLLFKELSFEELTHGVQPLHKMDMQLWLNFKDKAERPGIRT